MIIIWLVTSPVFVPWKIESSSEVSGQLFWSVESLAFNTDHSTENTFMAQENIRLNIECYFPFQGHAKHSHNQKNVESFGRQDPRTHSIRAFRVMGVELQVITDIGRE